MIHIEKNNIKNGKKNEKRSKLKDLSRKTFYIREDQDIALKLMATMEKENEYDIVIKALDEFIPKKYFDMAQSNNSK